MDTDFTSSKINLGWLTLEITGVSSDGKICYFWPKRVIERLWYKRDDSDQYFSNGQLYVGCSWGSSKKLMEEQEILCAKKLQETNNIFLCLKAFLLYVFTQTLHHGPNVTQSQFLREVWRIWVQSFLSPRLAAWTRRKHSVCLTNYS